MSIIDTLIMDRNEDDLSALRSLMAIPFAQWTEEQKEQFKLAVSKGAYNASDLNRVTDACEYLADRLSEYGYIVNVKRPLIEETVVTPSESVMPEGYTELSYIQSTGTQYVDSGFKPNNNSRVVLDFEPTAAYSSIVSLFGTRDENSGTAANMFVFWNNGKNTFRTDYFGTQKTMTVSTLLSRQTVDKDKNVTTIGSVSASNTASTGQCSNNLYLFCANSAGTANYFSRFKLYSCQIYDNGDLIRDYIPCLTPDGEAGLYDIVSGAFYGNAGTGVFTAGEEVPVRGFGSKTETVIRDYWKVGDIPQKHHMKEYLQNINNLRSPLELASSTPKTPSDMDGLTIQEANDIEVILFAIYDVLTRVFAAFLRSGQFTFWSGNRPLPTGNTDAGRTWAELDAINTEWTNWQVATWYLLLYGNLQAEGVV